MTAGRVELRRPLAPSEAGTWLLDLGAPLTFVLVARVDGGLEVDALRAALDALQERHPALRARVVSGEDGGLAFTPEGVAPIPLRCVHAGPQAWTAEAEDELMTRFAAAGPLARATWLRHGPDSGTLLLALHHAVADGRSAFAVLAELLTAAGRLSAGRPAGLSPSTWTAPLEDCLPGACRGPLAALRRGLFVARTLWRDRRWGRAVRVRRDRELPVDERRPRVASLVLEPEELVALAARARDAGASLHGALAAALLLAVLADRDAHAGSAALVSLGSPLDVRPRLEPPPGPALGLLVGSLSFEQRVAPDTPFWELARRVRDALRAGLARGDEWSGAVLTPRVVDWLGGRRLSPREFALAWESQAGATCGLTNLGRLDVPERCGPLVVSDVQALSSPSALTDLVALVTTHGGRLRVNLMWPDPCLTRAHAQALVADVGRRLREASGR